MSAATLQAIVRRFQGAQVLIVGDIMLDEYIWGDAHRISPEAPVPVLQIQRRSYVPGGASNTAANVVGLGGHVLLGGIAGEDQEAVVLRQILANAGIDGSGLLADSARPTTVKTRIMARSQQIVRMDRESKQPLPRSLEDELLEWCRDRLGVASACVLSDYGKGVVTPRFAQELIQAAYERKTPVIVDPKGTDYTKYRGATAIKPNSHDVQQLLGRELTNEADWRRAGKELSAVLSGTALIISRGAEGMTLFRPDRLPRHIPSVARAVFDVTGAGDTVVGTLALSLAVNATLEQAAHLANRAAGVAVSKLGTTTVTRDELLHRVRGRRTKRSVTA